MHSTHRLLLDSSTFTVLEGPNMKDSKQGLVMEDYGEVARAESPPHAAAENSPLHSMMVYDGTITEDDGIHKTTPKKSSRRGSIVMVTLIVVATVGLLALIGLALWTPGSSSSGSSRSNNSVQNQQQQQQPKTSWPELVGEPGLEAQAAILAENSDIAMAPLVGLDCMVTMDYRTDRVWIWVNDDADQTVAQTPMIG
jgi:Potato inhibitor I family